MAKKTISTRQKQKYDTSTNWTTNNIVLLAGEIGIESDTNKFKVGNGTSTWNELDYAGGSEIPLYSTTGQNTDGAMTQKAVTDAIPTTLSDLNEDSSHRTVTDAEKTTWNNKSNFSGDYDDLTNKPTIPTTTSQLTNDSNFVSDSVYVHTDNNYTTSEKNKLAGIETGAEVNTVTSVAGKTGAVVLTATDVGALPNSTFVSTININGQPQSTINFDSDPQTQIDNIANNTTLIQNSSGGFNAGTNSVAHEGGAIGKNASSLHGGSIGNTAITDEGGAVGYQAISTNGGAIGQGTQTSNGFAGGYNAKTVSDGLNIDAIQLGTGTNAQTKTLQIYDDNIYNAETHKLGSALLDAIYPVGSIYMSVNSTNPSTLFGGTWEQFAQGRVLLGVGSNGETNYTTAEQTGGSENSVASHTHTQQEHNHTQQGHNHTLLSNTEKNSNANGFGANNKVYGVSGVWQDSAPAYQYYNVDNAGLHYVKLTRAINNPTTAVNNSTGEVGGNRMPFITCYIWKRTA